MDMMVSNNNMAAGASVKASSVPGAVFGLLPAEARGLDEGMGVAVARRTVFRPEDQEDFGRVADRVAAGNIALLSGMMEKRDYAERAYLRNAIASGALITSGRHLQHGDAEQANRPMEVFTNCASACASFSEFYLLLNGSGVGRAYDDDMMVVDWSQAPDVHVYLDPKHPDFPHTAEAKRRFAIDMGWVPYGADAAHDEQIATRFAKAVLSDKAAFPTSATVFKVPDSREGWAKAVEIAEAAAYAGDKTPIVFDLSAIRPYGSPIMGMQGRPASGPVSLARGLVNMRDQVIEPSRKSDPNGEAMQPWEQAMRLDHYLSVEVQCGGARRAARMATKSWADPGILRFIRAKSEGGLWTANNSVMVDAEFWDRVRSGDASDPMTAHARRVFEEVTRCSYINGEPGFINGDKLEDYKTGLARRKPVYEDGSDFQSQRYQADYARGLLAAAASKATTARFPATTNPCGEIVLHVTGAYCTLADFAPLLACPVPIESVVPGLALPEVAAEWDARVEASVRLAARFLVRTNRMDALYGKEVARTNRIGVGPTGLHEYAWMRYGLTFKDMLDPTKSGEFWQQMARLSNIAKEEANSYADELGMARPATVTTVKPAGTTSKLFGITEGVHLPARSHYLRWVQFRGCKDDSGEWVPSSDPLLAKHEEEGYPVRSLKSFPNMSIVGFPTQPLIARLGMGDDLVTAAEATPAEHYQWLKLLEQNWIGAEQGNQISYTLKLYTDRHELEEYRDLVLREQPQVRCCSILPSKPDHELGYEYLPEESVSRADFDAIQSRIHSARAVESVDMAHLQCAGGACPI